MNEKIRGLILKEINFGEADKILTVLTENNGKISILAKNIRKVKGRFGAGATFLCFSEFEITPSKNELYYLKRATPINNFFKLSESIEKLALATYMGQLASMAVPDEYSSDSDTLSLLLNTFYVLENRTLDLNLIKSTFELRLMAEEGYTPQIAECVKCGNSSSPFIFNLREGTVTCENCQGEGIKLSDALYQAMVYIIISDVKKLYSFDLGKENIKLLSDIAEKYTLLCMGREIPSLDYLKAVL